MFGIGMPELILILIIALVFIGPRKFPEIASALGRGYGEFQKALKNIKESVDEHADMDINQPINSTNPSSDDKEKDRS